MIFYLYNETDQIFIWIQATVIDKENVSNLLVLI